MVKHCLDPALFTSRGFQPREFSPHTVLCIPKMYPDAVLALERRGVPREELVLENFRQINVYASDLDRFPHALFNDPTINWHAQQWGIERLVAAAGVRGPLGEPSSVLWSPGVRVRFGPKRPIAADLASPDPDARFRRKP